jgi:hypothetical protein
VPHVCHLLAYHGAGAASGACHSLFALGHCTIVALYAIYILNHL